MKTLQIKFLPSSVYFKYYLTSTALIGNEVSTAIRCSILPLENHACRRSNDWATPNLIKTRPEKSAIWVYLKRQLNGPKRYLTQITVNKRNPVVRLIFE